MGKLLAPQAEVLNSCAKNLQREGPHGFRQQRPGHSWTMCLQQVLRTIPAEDHYQEPYAMKMDC
jgi:hypothetical protein